MAARDRLAQLRRAAVGVAVQLARELAVGRDRRRARPQRALVRGQLGDRPGAGAAGLAADIGHDLQDARTRPGGRHHATSVAARPKRRASVADGEGTGIAAEPRAAQDQLRAPGAKARASGGSSGVTKPSSSIRCSAVSPLGGGRRSPARAAPARAPPGRRASRARPTSAGVSSASEAEVGAGRLGRDRAHHHGAAAFELRPPPGRTAAGPRPAAAGPRCPAGSPTRARPRPAAAGRRDRRRRRRPAAARATSWRCAGSAPPSRNGRGRDPTAPGDPAARRRRSPSGAWARVVAASSSRHMRTSVPGREAVAGLLDQAAQDHRLAARADRRPAGGGGLLDAGDRAHDAQPLGQQLDHRAVDAVDLAAQRRRAPGRADWPSAAADLVRAGSVAGGPDETPLARRLSIAAPPAPAQGCAGCDARDACW